MRGNKGITLIALVITIIVLLILAAVAISTLTGENGILNKAKDAKEATEINNYKEQIELTRTELKLQNENYISPTIHQMEEALVKKEWVAHTEFIMDEGIEKLKLTTKEGYIFYITETETEYKGKGEIIDTSDLKREEALELKIVGDAQQGKLVQLTNISGKDYYKIEYQINTKEGNWTEIKSGETVEVAHSSTIHARLVYGSNKGVIVSLSIEASNPVVVAKNTNTNQVVRKTSISLVELFDITWGSDGIGTVEYSIVGNLNFKNTAFNSTKINNLSELEIGNYAVTCKITSPSNKIATATKQDVKVTKLANTTVTNASNNQVTANAVYSEYDLAYFRDLVNGGQNALNGKVMNDLNLSKVCGATIGNWEPIGNTKDILDEKTHVIYNGILEGGNHTIDYLYINNSNDIQGLFGVIENAKLTGIVIGGNSSVTGSTYVGGIAAYGSNSTITNCGNNSLIKAKVAGAGGILGVNKETEVIGNYNKGEIKGESNQYALGGICGAIQNATVPVTIKDNYNTGNIIGGYYVGGIIGLCDDYAKVSNCYNQGTITGIGIEKTSSYSLVGGITGRLRAYGEINYCYNVGTIVNDNTGYLTGGIVGTSEAYNGSIQVTERSSKIENSYNSGNITSKGIGIGGICGENQKYCYIKNSYIAQSTTVKYNQTLASDNIGSASNYLGKIVGSNPAGSNNITNVGVLSNMPTVYNVVNGLSNGDSQYWSRSNQNSPKLLWEK